MRILVAPDSFKGSLSAISFCDTAERALRSRFPMAEIVCVPMADGGEGTCEALARATGGKLIFYPSFDPLGRPITAFFAMLPGSMAAVEIAAASGLPLVAPAERDIFRASSFGTGLLLRAALDALWKQKSDLPPRLIIGLGGSATCDGGAGILQALGARLTDGQGHDVPADAEGLRLVEQIDPTSLDPRLAQTELIVACDVTAPLCGPLGASAVFAPQKGALPEQVPILDGLLRHWGELLRRDLHADVAEYPGSGAAGGAGAALRALGGQIRPGFDVLCDVTGLARLLEEKPFDLLITGEGQLSAQTKMGKLPARLAEKAKRSGVHTVAVVGAVATDGGDAASLFDRVIPLCAGDITPEYSMTHAAELLDRALRESEL
ncbi:MAG: glycerate kinase [Clostridiaceae bacterium]|nr:glycerate kinase [Clostridiaceae bacterium]